MKKLLAYSFIASSIVLTACNTKPTNNNNNTKTTTEASNGLRVAYVNIDTLQNNLNFFKTKKAEFETKENNIKAQLASMQQKIEIEYAALQKAAQAGTLSQAEGEAKQKKLVQMQQNYQSQQASFENSYTKELSDFNDKLQKRLDDYLAKYNKDKKYDIILSDMKGGQILLINPAFNITQDVINGMNAEPVTSDNTDTTKK